MRSLGPLAVVLAPAEHASAEAARAGLRARGVMRALGA